MTERDTRETTVKAILRPYKQTAQVMLGSISTFLVATGIYDAATMSSLLGAVGGFATGFWLVYDIATKKGE